MSNYNRSLSRQKGALFFSVCPFVSCVSTLGGLTIYSGCTQSLLLLLQMSRGEILGITASVKPVW